MPKFDPKMEAWRDQQARTIYPEDCQPLAERAATDYDHGKVTVDQLLREWDDDPTDEVWEANLGEGVRLLPEEVLAEARTTYFRIRPYSGDARRWAELNAEVFGFEHDPDQSTPDEVLAWAADGTPDIEVANLLKARNMEFDTYQGEPLATLREDAEEPVEYAAVDGAGKTLLAVKAATEDGARQLLFDRLRSKKKEMDTWQKAGERVVRQKVDPTPPLDTGNFFENTDEIPTYSAMKLSTRDNAVIDAFKRKKEKKGDKLSTDGIRLIMLGKEQAAWLKSGGIIFSERIDDRMRDHLLATIPRANLGHDIVSAFFEAKAATGSSAWYDMLANEVINIARTQGQHGGTRDVDWEAMTGDYVDAGPVDGKKVDFDKLFRAVDKLLQKEGLLREAKGNKFPPEYKKVLTSKGVKIDEIKLDTMGGTIAFWVYGTWKNQTIQLKIYPEDRTKMEPLDQPTRYGIAGGPISKAMIGDAAYYDRDWDFSTPETKKFLEDLDTALVRTSLAEETQALERYESLSNAQIEERLDRVLARSRFGETNFARFLSESHLPPRASHKVLDSRHADRRYVQLGEELAIGLRMPDGGWCLLGEDASHMQIVQALRRFMGATIATVQPGNDTVTVDGRIFRQPMMRPPSEGRQFKIIIGLDGTIKDLTIWDKTGDEETLSYSSGRFISVGGEPSQADKRIFYDLQKHLKRELKQ